MKKVFSLILTAALFLSLAVPASAASVAGNVEDLLPDVITADSENVDMYSMYNFYRLPEEIQAELEEAKENLPDFGPKGLRMRYFFYIDVDEEAAEDGITFKTENYWLPVIMQYVDGEWVERALIINEDGTVTVLGMVDAPTAYMLALKPLVISSSCDDYELYTEEELIDVSYRLWNVMMRAKRSIHNARPEGMLIQHFFYVELCSSCSNATMEFQTTLYNDLVIMQYVGGKWVDVEFTINEADSIVTATNIVDGPIVFFVK